MQELSEFDERVLLYILRNPRTKTMPIVKAANRCGVKASYGRVYRSLGRLEETGAITKEFLTVKDERSSTGDRRVMKSSITQEGTNMLDDQKGKTPPPQQFALPAIPPAATVPPASEVPPASAIPPACITEQTKKRTVKNTKVAPLQPTQTKKNNASKTGRKRKLVLLTDIEEERSIISSWADNRTSPFHIGPIMLTPKLASAAMERNACNRKLSYPHIQEHIDKIENNEFIYSGDPMKFKASTGKMFNAQHRSAACIITNTPIPIDILAGCADSMEWVTDMCRPKTDCQILSMLGYKNSSTLSASINWIDMISSGGARSFYKKRKNPEAKARFIEENPLILESSGMPGKLRAQMGIKGKTSVIASLHFLFSLKDKDDADKFFEILGIGVGYTVCPEGTGDPIFTLRKKMIQFGSQQSSPHDMRPLVVWFIKAWNAWRENKMLHRLIFTRGEKFREII